MRWLLPLILLLGFATFLQAGNNAWTTTGPEGASVSSFTFHPTMNQFILASSRGSAFRSRNGGVRWENLQLTEFIFRGSVLLVHPREPNIVLSLGRNVFRSSNLGSSWQSLGRQIINNDNLDWIWDAEFHPNDPRVVFALSYRNGVHKSTDGGATWTQKNNGLILKPVCRSEPNSLQLCDAPKIEIDTGNPNQMYVLLSSDKVFRTTNGGEAWKVASTGLSFGSSAEALALDPRNSQTLYAGGSNGLFKTTNGGAQWSKTSFPGPVSSVVVDRQNSQRVYAGGRGGVYRSLDAGRTWTSLPLPQMKGDSSIVLAIHPKQGSTLLAASFESGPFLTRNAGASWKLMVNGMDGLEIRDVEVNQKRPDQIFAVSEAGGRLYVSNNAGGTWNVVTALQNFFARDVETHPANANLVCVAGFTDTGDSIGLSADGGKTWRFPGPSFFSSSSSCAFDPQDQNTIYLVRLGLGVARTQDQGRTWSQINSGLSDRIIYGIGVDPDNGKTAYVVTGNGRAFKTVNGGSSWMSRSNGLPAGQIVRSVVVDPSNSNFVYAGSDRGAFRTTNGGTKWTNAFQSGDFVATDPLVRGTILAASFGRLVASNDFGASWADFATNGLPGFMFYSAMDAAIVKPQTLYLATGRGVYSYSRTAAVGGPTIQQVAPSSGRVGDTVSISGARFGTTQGNSSVQFGSVNAGTATSWTDNKVVVRVPQGARTGGVTVTAGGKKSNAFDFVLIPSTGPIEPSSGTSRGGTRVSIVSPGGIASSQFVVLFGTTLARDLKFTAPNLITCTSPPGNGTVTVVILSGGTELRAGTFQYN